MGETEAALYLGPEGLSSGDSLLLRQMSSSILYEFTRYESITLDPAGKSSLLST